MSRFTEEQDDVQFSEPILAQKGVRCGIQFAEKVEWEVKDKPEWSVTQREFMIQHLGKKFTGLKLTLTISDDTVRTERADAKPKLTIEDQFNIERFPYPDKKSGVVKWLGKQKLYQLEAAFGFDPIFLQDGNPVAAHVTKSGAKVAPKGENITRMVNPDFFNAYFTSEGDPVVDNWIGKTIYADVEVEKSEKFGDKNVIARYVKGPAI